ncbi:CHAT domain-containing tetratricopeptide repeat protein [Pseudodesulfovibrio sp.]|uniref:CHAT domain-containing protein n=1 Tax=Pseudodesulfovibrio sp. TaxID=2035812 RepID=UPI00262EDCAE|nr:CHAT domain-containing tetratricopeptide repeat protein [Pseudodesulfovibrio sp.]MDD3311446.1 CHAT domain-containing protein [Pseudodesulfovibrio sp.]
MSVWLVCLVSALCARPALAAKLPQSFFAVKAKIPMVAPEGLPARDAGLYRKYYQALHDWDGEKALSLMKERVELAKRSMPPKIQALLLAEYAQLHFSMGDSGAGLKAAREGLDLLQRLDNQGQRTVSFALIYVCRDRFLAGDLASGEAIQEPLFKALRATLSPQVFPKVERMVLGQAYNAYRERYVLSDARTAILESWLLEKPDQIDLGFESEIRLLLAIQYRIRGDLPKMEKHLERAYAIWRDLPDKEYRLYQYHALLGDLFLDFGNPEAARTEYEKGLALAEKNYVSADMRVTGLQIRLAKALLVEGESEAAGELCRSVVRTVTDNRGPFVYEVARAYSILSRIAALGGDRPKAWELLNRAREISERVIPADHPERWANRMAFARDALALGRAGEAAQAARQVIEACRDLGGDDNPLTFAALSTLGRAELAMGRKKDGYATLLRAEQVGIRQADMVQRLPSEAQRKAYLTSSKGNIELLLRAGEASLAPGRLYAVWLNRKGAFFESQARYRQALGNAPAEETGAAAELAAVRAQLAYAAYSPSSEGRSGRSVIAELTARRDELLRSLNAKNRKADGLGVSPETLSLPANAALVDFVHLPPAAERPGGYWAFVVRPQKGVNLIPLGDAEEVNDAIAAWRGEIVKGSRADAAVLGAQAGRLRALLVDPLAPALAGARRLLAVPDGPLQRLPLEILQRADGSFLAEHWRITYLATARELARPKKPGDINGAVVILANPDFGTATVPGANVKESPKPGADSRVVRLSLAPLPGTEAEGQAIRELAGNNAHLITGAAASKSALFGVRRPRVLHLATHGFFLDDGDAAVADERRSFRIETTGSASVQAWLSPAADPLLRSGLILAGAAEGGNGNRLAAQGVLTAEEVLGLDLAGTELVTLSACGTGLGAIADADGVYGLRRSFLLAGARHLVVSLWSVPDEETRRTMVDMYDRFLQQNMPVDEAFHQAMLDRLAAERKAGRADNPFYWAGFVVYGAP